MKDSKPNPIDSLSAIYSDVLGIDVDYIEMTHEGRAKVEEAFRTRMGIEVTQGKRTPKRDLTGTDAVQSKAVKLRLERIRRELDA